MFTSFFGLLPLATEGSLSIFLIRSIASYSFFCYGCLFITTLPCGKLLPCIKLLGGRGLFEGELPPNLISDFLMTNFNPGGEIAGLIKLFFGLLFV
jgi:hypothetical protein